VHPIRQQQAPIYQDIPANFAGKGLSMAARFGEVRSATDAPLMVGSLLVALFIVRIYFNLTQISFK
jgi:hypothetical protein